MKKEPALTTGISEPGAVYEFMQKLRHPMKNLVSELCVFFLSVDKNIGQGVAWNAPVFFYTGKMKPFDPKEYKRYIVGFNFYRQDTIRLIFLRGADASDPKGILEGDYKDGRRLVSITGKEDLENKLPELKKIVKQLLKQMDK